ncbi:MAG: von Willebrand factor type A domain-containing protein [Lachnospiraceae bacterium]|nr:von Willebrand factor type A domain-containing protein [Lachnospiraceae bacterium]
MDFKAEINCIPEKKEKYDYILSLGYGEKAACVLAMLTYGSLETACLASIFPREHRLDRIYDWLLEQPNYSSTDIRNYIKEHISELPDAIRKEAEPLLCPENDPRLFGVPTGASAGMGMPGPMMMAAATGGGMMTSNAMFSGGVMKATMSMAQPAMPAMGMRIDPEKIATDSYELIEEKDAKSVLTSPTSTFRMTTSTASVGILLNQRRNGRSIDISQVRIEELLNYFDYDHKAANAEKKAPFKINSELMDKGKDKKLLYIHVEADDTPKEHQNIVLLLDTSGSMTSQRNVTIESLATIVSKLKEGDVLSLITYSTEDHTIFSNHVVGGSGDLEDILGDILTIFITGCTNGSAGIETAYAIGEKTYKDGWNNQVILITDGDLNFGINSKDGLKNLIEEKKKTGMFLSVIGTGLYNYKDDKLEVLSKHGNGTYCVVNAVEDVKESIDRKFVSLTNIVAKDVKAQVEFNPKYVQKYRLLGYENRTLNHEDFRNDAVISEPYGSGGHGVALYELPMGNAVEEPAEKLKYQRLMTNDYEELGTVSVRFKAPLSEVSEEISEIIPLEPKATDNSKLAYFLYCVSEVLRKSDKLDDDDYAFLLDMLNDEKYKTLAGDKQEALDLLLHEIDTDIVTKAREDHKTKEAERAAIQMGLLQPNPDGSGFHYVDTTDRPMSPPPMNGFIGTLGQGGPMMNLMMQQMNQQQSADPTLNMVDGPGSQKSKPENLVTDGNTWACPLCGCSADNRGKFCMTCGAVRPADVWQCSCGRFTTAKFCPDCGSPKPTTN